MIRRSLALALLLLLAAVAPWTVAQTGAKAPKVSEKFQQAIPRIEAKLEPAVVKRGQEARLLITVEIAPGWHSYPSEQPDENASSQINEFKPLTSPDFASVGPVKNPSNFLTKAELVLDIKELRYYEGTVTYERPVVIAPTATPGEKTLTVPLVILVCDEKGCLPPTKVEREVRFTVSDAPPTAVAAPTGPKTDAAPSSTEPKKATREVDEGLWAFVLSGAFWGAVSLVTPCVFPMIPITVSFFLKQSEKEHHQPVRMALVYCLTIVVVLTVGAVLLLSVFQAAIQYPATNLILGGLFVVFALSLFGMYDITLPSGLATFTSAREAKGGMLGTVFMALTFSIISFSCVAPFMGGFAALTPSAGNTWEMLKAGELGKLGSIFGTLLLGALAFSVTFASPFFFLALFPSLLRSLPRSGAWMNTVKVVMGFLEVAAALKFLRAAELLYRGKAELLTYDLVLGSYVALCLACGLYLLNLYRLPHDHDAPEQLGVPRLLCSVAFLTLAFYLMPALLKHGDGQPQRPRGTVFAWLDSFLLPDEPEPTSAAMAGPEKGRGGHLAWVGNFEKGLQAAHDKRRLVFIDFTGLT